MKFPDYHELFCIFWAFNQTCSCRNLTNLRLTSKSFSNLAQAANEIVEKDFSVGTTTSNLILSDSSDLSLRDFAEELLSRSFEKINVVIRQESPTAFSLLRNRRRRCAIFVISRFEQFQRMYPKITREIFFFNGYFLIVLTNGTIPEIKEIFRLVWKLQMYNVNLMYEAENESIMVKSFIPFKPGECHSTTPILINQFKDGKFISVESLYPLKMRNLHNCTVNVAASYSVHPFIIPKLSTNGSIQLTGQDISLLKTLSETLNMNINFAFIGEQGFIYDNGTGEGPFKALLDGVADLTISGWLIRSTRSKFFDATTSYTSVPINFVISLGTQLTSFEKLIFPFERLTWILIALCLLIGSIVISIVKCCSKMTQNFIFGTKVDDPYLNMFIGFIGGTQKVLPRRNFARFLLVVYLMYCLVMRTLYQAAYFQLMQSSKRHDEVQTIEEMVEKDFKFYVPIVIADIFLGAEIIKNR